MFIYQEFCGDVIRPLTPETLLFEPLESMGWGVFENGFYTEFPHEGGFGEGSGNREEVSTLR